MLIIMRFLKKETITNIIRRIKGNYNLLRFFLCYQSKSLRLPYPPFLFWIEPTNSCNLRCISCPQSLKENKGIKKGFMSLDLCKKLIDEMESFKPKGVTFHLAGESMLHPDLFSMIKLAKNANLFVMMSTNGTLLTDEKAKALIDSGLDVLRIDFSPDKKKFEEIRSGAEWDQVLRNIKNLLKLKATNKSLFPAVSIINWSIDDPTSFSQLRDLFRDLPVDEIANFKAHNWAGKFADLTVNGFFLPISKKSYFPCSHLWSSLAIRWDGKVVPCCHDLQGDYIVGDANKSSLLEIWNGEKLVTLRHRLKTRNFAQIRLCRNCSKLWEGKPYHLIPKYISGLRKSFHTQTGRSFKMDSCKNSN